MVCKYVVSRHGEVDTVKGEFDIPVAGIDKGNVQILCQQPVFLCKLDGLRNQRICEKPGN